MNGLATGVAMAGAVTAYVGIYHLWLHLRRPRRSDLYFALTCACMTAYDALAAQVYSAPSFEVAGYFQKLQFASVVTMGMPLIYLVSEQGGIRIGRVGALLGLLFPLVALVIAVEQQHWTVTTVPLPKTFQTPWGTYQILEMAVGPLQKAMESTVPLLILYCLWVGLGAPRFARGRGLRRQTQRSSPIVFVAACLLLTALHDIFVNRGLLSTPYVLEYGWLAVMATMSFSLSDEVLEAARTRRTLDETERRVKTTLDAIQDAVVTTDLGGNVTHMNPAAEKLLAVSLWDALDQPLRQFVEISLPETHGVVADPVLFAVGRTSNPYGKLPQLVTTDGNERHVDIGGTALKSPSGQVEGAIIVLRDLTLQQKALETLQHAKKMESMGQLAGGAAHDLNNLLTPIISYVELMQRQVDAQSKSARFLEHVQEAAQRAAELTRQLLAFSRKQVLDVQVVPLAEFLRQTRPLIERLVGEKVEVRLVLDDRAGRVRIDPGQFEQVLLNLASNARDAMDGGGTLVLKTRRISDSEVCLEVTDNGCGIDVDTLERIFEPFYTTKPRGKGTGLGLASVRGIIEQHGGSIFVDSELARGTSFEIFLPTTQKAQPGSSHRVIPKPDLVGGTEHILVVEDDQAVRVLIHDALSQLGYTVYTADGLASALSLAQQERIDMLLSDVVLPGADGPRIRDELQKYVQVPCLFMTGHADDRLGDRGIISRGTQVLRKPFTVVELGERVRQVLDARCRTTGRARQDTPSPAPSE